MEKRLAFGFYRALFNLIETYEAHFAQLERDYKRELKGETLFFAVDFSELHPYIHFATKHPSRAAINKYILNTLNDQFSLLPGAVGELFADIERAVPKHLKPDFGKALYSHPNVAEFLSSFSQGIQDEKRLADLYTKAETELRKALGSTLDVLMQKKPGETNTSVEMLMDLLERGKLAPIEGLQQIGPLTEKSKKLAQLVMTYLEVDRPALSANNQSDAADFLFTLLLNQQEDHPNARYITIYSQSRSLIGACRQHNSLRWKNDYLVREAKYLQYRTKLQELLGSVKERHDRVVEWRKLCLQLKSALSSLVDLNEQRPDAINPSIKLIDLYRKFDEECKKPLSFSGEVDEAFTIREQARKLYQLLKDEGTFAGKVEEAFDVFEEHLRHIHTSLRAFLPDSKDTLDTKTYKENIRRWLEVSDSPGTNKGSILAVKED